MFFTTLGSGFILYTTLLKIKVWLQHLKVFYPHETWRSTKFISGKYKITIPTRITKQRQAGTGNILPRWNSSKVVSLKYGQHVSNRSKGLWEGRSEGSRLSLSLDDDDLL